MSYACDERGYINFVEGLVIKDRYQLVAQIGKGTFSRVMKCKDIKYSSKNSVAYIALKINRNVDKYKLAAKVEYEILSTIKKYDKENNCLGPGFCAHLTSSFDYFGHRCFVFPLYGRSVYGFLSSNKYTPFASLNVKQFAWQIIQAVKFLHKLKIIFTDLKLENIVFMTDRSVRRKISTIEAKLPYGFHFWKKRMQNAGYTKADVNCLTVEIPIDIRLKVIDFGSALFEARWHNHLVQTRHYRAPEVILGMHWSFPIDIWSVGCVLLELIYGRMVFNTHDSIDHLNQMHKMIGPMPDIVRSRIPDEVREAYFKPNGDLKLERAKISTVQCHALGKYFGPGDADMLDLVQRMLRWDPAERISATDALNHPYFKDLDTSALQPKSKRVPQKRRSAALDTGGPSSSLLDSGVAARPNPVEEKTDLPYGRAAAHPNN